MMRLSFLLLFFIPLHAFAQKVDLDKVYVPLKFISLPQSNALKDLRTYTVLLYSDPATLKQIGISNTELESALALNGYIYKAAREVDVAEELSIGNIRALSQGIQSYQVQNKNSEGAVISTTTVYYVTSSVIVPSYIRLTDKVSGRELENIVFADANSPLVYRSKDFYSNAEATQFMNTSLEYDRSEFITKTYREKFFSVFNTIHKKYCFEFEDYKELFWEIDLKKNPEYKEFNEKLDVLKQAFGRMTYSSPVQPLREELSSVLTYYSDQAHKINAEDKKTRKLKYAYLINLARAQFWLELLDECEATCQEIIKNDYDEGDGNFLLRSVKDFRRSLELNGVSSRHFEREGFQSSEKFKVAGNILFAQTKEQAPAGFNVLQGYIIDYSGQRLDGELWVKNIDHNECFKAAYGTVFVYNTPSGQKKMTITADNIKMLSVGESANFISLIFKNNVGLPEKKQLFRILYENDEIAVFKTYSTSNSSSGILDLDKTNMKELWTRTDLCLMKKSTMYIQPVSAVSKQKVTENVIAFYEGCPTLQAKISSEEIKDINLISGQRVAADFFAQNCK